MLVKAMDVDVFSLMSHPHYLSAIERNLRNTAGSKILEERKK